MAEEGTATEISVDESWFDELRDMPTVYAWYVETVFAEPQDGIFLGAYVAVDSDGTLRICAPGGEIVHQFVRDQWKFVFPKFWITQDHVEWPGEVTYSAWDLSNPNADDLPSKSAGSDASKTEAGTQL